MLTVMRLHVVCFEEFFGIDRRHATGAGSRDRLTVNGVCNVSGGEDSGDIRLRRPRFCENVSVLVEGNLALEDVCIRLVADTDEETIRLEFAHLSGEVVFQFERGQTFLTVLLLADNIDDLCVPYE